MHPYRDDGRLGSRHGRRGTKEIAALVVVLAVWCSWSRSKYAAKFCGILEKRKKGRGEEKGGGKCVEVLLFRLRHMTAGNKILPSVDLAICPRLFSLSF